MLRKEVVGMLVQNGADVAVVWRNCNDVVRVGAEMVGAEVVGMLAQNGADVMVVGINDEIVVGRNGEEVVVGRNCDEVVVIVGAEVVMVKKRYGGGCGGKS